MMNENQRIKPLIKKQIITFNSLREGCAVHNS